MKVTQHPNGFVRVEFFKKDSGESDRMHVWDTPGYEDGDIHQHEADFLSTIVEGEMMKELYRFTDDPQGEYERWNVVCYTDESGVYHVDDDPDKPRCTPRLTEMIVHKAGDTYRRPASDFHKVIALKTPLIITRGTTGQAYMRRHYMLRKIDAQG